MDIENFFEEAGGENREINTRLYSPLNLAYIGDAVYEMLVRSKIVAEGNRPVNDLNKMATSYVRASAQAKIYYKIIGLLTEDELSVLKRGRNAKTFSHAKNASVTDYRLATGVEALFGYLYLKGQNKRITELFHICSEDEGNHER